MSEKKITFSGVDNGIASQFEKFRRMSKQMADEMVGDSRRQSTSLKEQLKLINDLVEAKKRLSKSEQLESKFERENFKEHQDYLKGIKDPTRRKEEEERYKGRRSEFATESLGVYDFVQSAKQAKETINAEAKAQKEKENFSKRAQKDEEKVIKQKLKLADEEQRNKQSLWDQEIRENKEGVIANIKRNRGKQGLFGKEDWLFEEKLTPTQREKLMYQRERVGEGPKQQNIVQAILAAEAIKEVINTARKAVLSTTGAGDEDFLSGKLSGGIAKAGGIAASAGLGGAAGIFSPGAGQAITAGGIATSAIMGDLVESATDRYNSESKARDISRNTLYGATGKGLFGGVSQFGVSQAQLGDIAKVVAVQYGTSAGLSTNVRNQFALERAYGLDRGLVGRTNEMSRLTDSSSITTIATLVSTLEKRGVIKKGDYSQLGELIQTQNSLVSQQSKVLEKPDVNVNTGIIAAFKQIGGSFSGPQIGDRISQLSNALASPSNDFQRAQSFGVLNKIQPGASLFELMKMQSKGIAQEGFASETMKQLERQYGSGEAFKLAVMGRTGYSPEQTETLTKAFQADRGLFDKLKPEDINKLVGVKEGEIQKRGASLVSDNEKTAAQISDAFAASPVKGIETALKLGLKKWSAQVEAAIKAAFDERDGKKTPKTNKTYQEEQDQARTEHYSEQKN